MNFQELMTVAEHKQENISKTKNVSRYSLDLPAPKKEVKPKPKSKIVQSLIEEKKREKEAAEKAERERKEEERKKNQFRIPKKKPDSRTIDKDSLINSLFDDSGVQSGESSSENAILHKHSKDKTGDEPLPSSHKDRHSSHQTSSSHKDRHSSHHRDSHSGHGTSRSSDNKHQDKSSKEPSSRKHEKHKSSSSSSHKDSSQSNHHTSSKSTTENHKSGSLSSDKKPSQSLETKSSHQPTHSTSSSNKSSGDKSKAPSDGQPVVLTKHHLNPTIERQASEMSEREKILAKLAAIKQRTLEALHKENASKGKRMKGDKSHRKSKGEEKLEDKAKSVEIIRGEISSGEEDNDRNDVPSALDVMLSDRNAKLEKDKISRLAKQAWERATKKSSDTEEKVKKNSKSSSKESHSKKHHKLHKSSHRDQRKAHSLSPSTTRSNKPLIKPKKFKSSQPPPLDFKTILAMAEQKQKEPPKPVGPLPKKKKEEDERPLTQEEKDRRERKKSKAYQEWLQKGGQRPDQRDANGRDTLPPSSSSSSTQMTKIKPIKPSATPHDKHKHVSKPSENGTSKAKSMTVNENVLVCGPGEYSEDDEESPRVRQQQGGGNPFDKIMQQFHKKRPGAQISSDIPSKRRILDSEEEESDDDSFIDDGDDGELDYSKEIQKMFGYNKSKYKDEDDDDLAGMEASFSTVMAEEKRSAKLGLLEDLEDMRREEEELKRKALMKKQMKKGK